MSERPSGPLRTRRSRADVVDAAAVVFARLGYAEATVTDIADELGILKGSLYHHVRSKSDLLYEVVQEPVGAMVGRLEQIVAEDAPAADRLETFVRMHVDALVDHFPNLSVYLHERFGTEGPADAVRQLSRRYQSLVEQLVRDGVEQGALRRDLDPQIVASTLLGSLNWLPKWIDPSSPEHVDAVADTIVAMSLDGLRHRDDHPHG